MAPRKQEDNRSKKKSMSRKARRKKERDDKKKRKADFNCKFSFKELAKLKTSMTTLKKTSKTETTPCLKKATPTNRISNQRKVVSAAEERDRKEIRRLEKLLHIKKKKLPQSFSADGLDCIF